MPLHPSPVFREAGRFELATQVGNVAAVVPPGPDVPRGAILGGVVVVDIHGGELEPVVLCKTVAYQQETR